MVCVSLGKKSSVWCLLYSVIIKTTKIEQSLLCHFWVVTLASYLISLSLSFFSSQNANNNRRYFMVLVEDYMR